MESESEAGTPTLRRMSTEDAWPRNDFKIGYNAFEFILDLGKAYDAGKKPKLHTRIIVTPDSAKNLLTLIQEAMDNYEQIQ